MLDFSFWRRFPLPEPSPSARNAARAKWKYATECCVPSSGTRTQSLPRGETKRRCIPLMKAARFSSPPRRRRFPIKTNDSFSSQRYENRVRSILAPSARQASAEALKRNDRSEQKMRRETGFACLRALRLPNAFQSNRIEMKTQMHIFTFRIQNSERFIMFKSNSFISYFRL